MKILGVFFLMLVAGAAFAQTNQNWPVCRNPVRVFGRTTVDLAPLFQWWKGQPVPTNAAGYTSASIDVDTNAPAGSDRPLAAWQRVTGTHVAAGAGGSWIVDAVIYTSPSTRTNARIFLYHPPAVEEQYYLTLKTQLAQAIRQIAGAQNDYEAANKAADKYQKRATGINRAWDFNDYPRLAAQQRQAADAALLQKQQLEAARAQIEQQLKTLPAVNETYHIDWFAVMHGRTKHGLPIYDLGLVSASPP